MLRSQEDCKNFIYKPVLYLQGQVVLKLGRSHLHYSILHLQSSEAVKRTFLFLCYKTTNKQTNRWDLILFMELYHRPNYNYFLNLESKSQENRNLLSCRCPNQISYLPSIHLTETRELWPRSSPLFVVRKKAETRGQVTCGAAPTGLRAPRGPKLSGALRT